MASNPPASQLLTRFQRLFRGRENAYGQWVKDAVKTVGGLPSEKEWTNHLAGVGPILGIVPIMQDNSCYFGVIDLDDDEVNHAALAVVIEAAKLPLTVFRSKSGGAHLYLFMQDPVPAKLIKEKLTRWAQAINLKNPPYPNGSPHPIEVFPKQAKMNPEDNQRGNWINLPYYGGDASTRKVVLADASELTMLEFLEYAEMHAISSMSLDAIEADVDGRFKQGPPCLKALDLAGLPEGGRNMGLFNAAIYFKLANDDTWKDDLREYNQSGKVEPPLKEVDIKAIIKSLENRDYQYKCDDNPIAAFCQKTACKKEKFGISGFRLKKLAGSIPEMSNLRKVTTDPPRWMLAIEGQDVELTTEDLMLMPRFRRAVMERCSMVFPLMKQFEWDDQLSTLLKNHTIIEAPSDAGINGVFVYLFYEFLQRRRNARNREDLLAGLPFQEGNRVLFRSTDFISYLDRKRFKDYDAPKVFMALRKLGAGHDKLNIKGASLQLWFIEPPKEEQNEEFEPLKNEEPAF